jgi:hypothetical protein
MSTPRGGSYCSPAGAEGETAAGTPMVCSVGKPGDRARWRRNGPAPARKARKPRASTSISVAPQPAPTEVQPMLPDPIDDAGIAQVAVFCDGCRTEHRGDYVGATPEIRLAAARAFLAGLGWQNAGDTDLCPACLAAMSPSGGPVLLVEDEGQKVFGALPKATQDSYNDLLKHVGITTPQADDTLIEGTRGEGKTPESAMRLLPPPIKAGDYLPATPERRNTWGGMPGPADETWRHHWDGPIPRAADSLGQDQLLNVDGKPLGDVLRQIATDVTQDKMAPRDAWDRVASLRDRVPADSSARRALDFALEDMGPRHREPLTVPESAPAPLAELARELHAIPLACRPGGELDRVDKILENYRVAGRMSRFQLQMGLDGLMGGTHESNSDCGYQQMAAAVAGCLKELRGLR